MRAASHHHHLLRDPCHLGSSARSISGVEHSRGHFCVSFKFFPTRPTRPPVGCPGTAPKKGSGCEVQLATPWCHPAGQRGGSHDGARAAAHVMKGRGAAGRGPRVPPVPWSVGVSALMVEVVTNQKHQPGTDPTCRSWGRRPNVYKTLGKWANPV